MGKPFIMRAADRIARGVSWGTFDGPVMASKMGRQEITSAAVEYPRFLVDDIWAHCSKEYKNGVRWKFKSDFPTSVPPFPRAWIEYRLGDGNFIIGLVKGMFCGTGSPFNERYPDAYFLTHVELVYLVRGSAGWSAGWSGSLALGFSADGECVTELHGSDSKYASQGDVMNFAVPIFYCMTMLNCRSDREIVRISDETHPDHAKRSIREKTGLPLLSYKTLHVGAALSAASKCQKSFDQVLAKRLHSVRAHWKHYPESRKLFGKHVGTFFCPAHERGDESLGVVVKDYCVHAR